MKHTTTEMTIKLTITDIDVILESLEYSRHYIENYPKYPSYEFKQKQLEGINNAEAKIRALKKELTGN